MPCYFCFFIDYVLVQETNAKVSDENMRSKKVVLKKEECVRILEMFHSGVRGSHSGCQATLKKISDSYFWPGLKEDVFEFVKCCAQCQSYQRIETMSPTLKPIKSNEPLQLVCMDLIGL